ncbi:hypothetical protein [Arthrobacter sp. UYCo732]|uniref:hypothetical protein n=1 Tax=Arthrobacter sp. UYCo732 TaxID=3156336 RepID=UPI00339B2B4A
MSGPIQGDGNPEVLRPADTPGAPPRPPGRSWRFDVAWIGAFGIGLYVLLRFPFAVFYSELGTTPEEAGLTYSQTLAQSSLAVLVIFVLVVLSTWLLLTYLRHTVRGAMVGRGPNASRRYLAGLDEPEFEKHLAKLTEYWSRNPADLATFEHEMPLRSWLREFDRLRTVDNRQRAEARAVLRTLSSGDHFTRRPVVFVAVTVAYVAVVLVGVGPMLARDQADRLKHCEDGQSFPGFRFAGPHVQLFKTETNTEAYADRKLLLLGGDSSRYVLYDCNKKTILRVPNSSYIVINAGDRP